MLAAWIVTETKSYTLSRWERKIQEQWGVPGNKTCLTYAIQSQATRSTEVCSDRPLCSYPDWIRVCVSKVWFHMLPSFCLLHWLKNCKVIKFKKKNQTKYNKVPDIYTHKPSHTNAHAHKYKHQCTLNG